MMCIIIIFLLFFLVISVLQFSINHFPIFSGKESESEDKEKSKDENKGKIFGIWR